MPIKINGTNTAANPSITGSDTDTGIVYGSDQIDFSTGGTSRAAIDGSGHLKFTGTTEEIKLSTSDASDNGYLNLSGGGACSQNRAAQVVMYGNEVTDNQGKLLLMAGNSGNANGTVDFYSGGSKRMVIDSSGVVRIGGTDSYNASDKLTLVGSGNTSLTIDSTSTTESSIFFADGATGNEAYRGYLQYKNADDALAIGTAASERIRINSSGHFLFNCTSMPSTSVAGMAFEKNGSSGVLFHSYGSSTGSINVAEFINGNGTVGRIQTNGSTTTYHTSSDYRLKENQVAISDGITRLKSLKPYRFNFKADSTKTVDGFFAHEVSPVVPEAIGGEKDAVKEDGSIDPQGIDQSKLVPLLTAALQEAVGKIEILETKVAALEAA